MASEYAQRFVNALVVEVAKEPNEVAILGEVSAEEAKPPHVAVYLQVGPGVFLGTTAGLSGRPAPLPLSEGLQYFELCALTAGHSPGVLKFLSDIGLYILGALAPASANGAVKPFLPYEAIQVSNEERLLLVPRWSFLVPEGRPVDVVEPLPLSTADWEKLGPLSLEERASWTKSLGAASAEQWRLLFPKL